jgi:predicted Zn-dependent protease
MGKVFFLLISFLFISCQPEEIIQTNFNIRNPPPVDIETDRFYWPKSDLQNHSHDVKVATQIDNAMTTTLMDASFNEWNLAVTSLNFYTIPYVTIPNINSNNLSDYRNDANFGIYKVTNWPSELGINTIAVTANYYNTTPIFLNGIKYFKLVHSDILVNYLNHQFTISGEAGKFDLPSVLTHEIGHMIGMKHAPYSESGSVMRSTAMTSDFFRTLTSYDIQNVSDFYENEIPNNMALTQTNAIIDSNTYSNSEGEAQVIFKLMANGTCLHYVNNQLIHSHKSKINNFFKKISLQY